MNGRPRRTRAPSASRRLTWIFLFGVAAESGAQSAAGRVVQSDSVTPVVGAIVSALDSAGNQVVTALSGPTGRYGLRLASPGRYTIRAIKVGYHPATVENVMVTVDSVTVGDLVLSRAAIELPGVDVRETSECDLKGAEATTFLQIWEQASAALAAARLLEQQGPIAVHLVRVDGQVDAMQYYSPRMVGEPKAEMRVSSARELVADRLYAATPPETLETAGYIRRRPGGMMLYDAPSPSLFLTDGFMGRTCFRIVSPPKGYPTAWVGIAFRPRVAPTDIADVSGTIWVDGATSELRRIEFEYLNVPKESRRVCEGYGLNDPIRRECYDRVENGSNRAGVGGHVDYQRLPTGQWLAVRWTVRTLTDTFNYRPSGHKVRYLSPRESCSSPAVTGAARRPGDCVNVYWPVPRLSVESTTVVRFVQRGIELYRNDMPLSMVMEAARKRGGKHPASLVANVSDAGARGLRHAVVQIEGTGRVGITESDGIARVGILEPGPAIVSVRCRGYQTVRFSMRLQPDSTHQIAVKMSPEPGRRETIQC